MIRVFFRSYVLKYFLLCAVLLSFSGILIIPANLNAEGQTRFNEDFFHNVKPIKLKDPLAVLLGAMDANEVFTYTYADAVKFAGHSCLAVAGAYKSTQIALQSLYGDETPVRGNIKVVVKGNIDLGVNGPISQVITMITGAAPESGFKGFGPKGKYGRYNLMTFDNDNPPDPKATSSITFQRIDNGEKVEITYFAHKTPMDKSMGELMPFVLSGKASEKEARIFGQLMQNRVKTVLTDPPDTVFVIK